MNRLHVRGPMRYELDECVVKPFFCSAIKSESKPKDFVTVCQK